MSRTWLVLLPLFLLSWDQRELQKPYTRELLLGTWLGPVLILTLSYMANVTMLILWRLDYDGIGLPEFVSADTYANQLCVLFTVLSIQSRVADYLLCHGWAVFLSNLLTDSKQGDWWKRKLTWSLRTPSHFLLEVGYLKGSGLCPHINKGECFISHPLCEMQIWSFQSYLPPQATPFRRRFYELDIQLSLSQSLKVTVPPHFLVAENLGACNWMFCNSFESSNFIWEWSIVVSTKVIRLFEGIRFVSGKKRMWYRTSSFSA